MSKLKPLDQKAVNKLAESPVTFAKMLKKYLEIRRMYNFEI